MAATSIPDEMIKSFVQLNGHEQKSVLQLVKTFLNNKKISQQPQTIEEYNKEIKAALKRAKRGEVTSVEKLEEEMKVW